MLSLEYPGLWQDIPPVFSRNKIVGEVDNSSKNYKEISEKISDYISEFKVISA